MKLNEWISKTENQGTYVRYEPIGKEELEEFISDTNKKSVFKNFDKLAEKQINYKNNNLSDFKKKNATGRKYMNIYAHKLEIMLPTMLPKNISYLKIVETLLHRIDFRIKEKELLWGMRLLRSSNSCYAEVILFTRPFLKKSARYETYKSDYWWNPTTKKRGRPHQDGCILLHRKGEERKDSEGKPILRSEENVSDFECRIFKYTGKSGFLKKMKSFRKILKDVLKNIISFMQERNSHYFKNIPFKKGQKTSTLYKIIQRNKLIGYVNCQLTPIFEAFRYGGLDENPFLCKEIRKLLKKLNSYLYEPAFNQGNIEISLRYNLSWSTFKMNFDDLWSLVNCSLNDFYEKNHNVVSRMYNL